jgi:hypothetical protein
MVESGTVTTAVKLPLRVIVAGTISTPSHVSRTLILGRKFWARTLTAVPTGPSVGDNCRVGFPAAT